TKQTLLKSLISNLVRGCQSVDSVQWPTTSSFCLFFLVQLQLGILIKWKQMNLKLNPLKSFLLWST
ncbi:hypothetical protein Csa_023526, partial [Cucumis sativus]